MKYSYHSPRLRTTLLALFALAIGAVILPDLAAPAAAQEWQVKRRTRVRTGVFVLRYKRLLEGRPKMGFVFKRLLQLYSSRGGATALIKEYLAKAKKRPQAWNLQLILGHLYRHIGKSDEASQHYQQAQKLAPKRFLPAYALAEALAARRKTRDAAKAYELALTLAKGEDRKRDCLQKLAALALREGKTDTAKKHLRALLTVGPKNLSAREDLAALLARHGLNKEALKEYRYIVRRIRHDNKKVALMLREIGGLEDKVGEPKKALKSYRRALRLLTRRHWLRRELLERIVDLHRRRGSLGALAAQYAKRVKRSPRDAEAWFTLAKLREELGKEPEAVKALQRALRLKPRSSEARLKLIDLLEGNHRSKEALRHYHKLVALDRANPEHHLRLSRALLRRGDRKAARKTLGAAARRFSDSVPVLKAVADLYAKHGMAKDALLAYKRLTRLAPGDPEYRRRMGDILLAGGNLEAAEKEWQEVLRTSRKKAAGYLQLAHIYSSHGLTAKSIATLLKAVKADPDNVKARLELARALGRARRHREALSAWMEVWKRAKEARHLRAAETQLLTLYEQRGLLAEVVVEKRDEFKKNPKNLRAGRLLAQLYQKLKNLLAAEQTLREVLKHHPNDVETLLDLERLHAARGELGKARDLLVRAAKLDRRRAKRHYRRAIEHTLKMENANAALALAREVVNLNPVDPEAHGQLAVLYRKAGRLDDAAQAFARAIQLAPQAFKHQLALGDLQRRLGRPQDAHSTYRAVVSGSTDESTIMEATKRLLALAREQGRAKELEKELQRISAANPKSMGHYQALAEYYRAMGRLDLVNQVLVRASRRTTDRSSALGILAAQAREKGDVRRAISYMRRQIRESDKPTASQYRALAELYFELGDTTRARQVINELVRAIGNKARAYQTAASLYQKHQMYTDALRALASQVKYNPADLAAKLKLSQRYIEADRLRDAEKLLWEVVRTAVSSGPSLGQEQEAVTPRRRPTPSRISRTRRRFGFRSLRMPARRPVQRKAKTDLRRQALGLLVSIYERWGNPDALTARLEKGLSDPSRARALLSDLVSIYRLRGQTKKVAGLLKRGVRLFPKEPKWLALLAQIELEQERYPEALKIYARLQSKIDPARARNYALKRLQILLDRNRSNDAKKLIEDYLGGRDRVVGFLSRAADLFAGRGNFKEAVALLERVDREDTDARALVREKLVEYLIASGRRKGAAAVLMEALRESLKSPVSNPTSVYASRERRIRRLFALLDAGGRRQFVRGRRRMAQESKRNLLVLLDLHLGGLISGDVEITREPLPTLLELGYRDKHLVSVAVERLVLSNDFERLGGALRVLFKKLRDGQEKKRIAEQALTHMRSHRRIPPTRLAALITRAYLGGSPGTSEFRNLGELYAAWGNFREATRFYERSLKRSPGDPSLYQKLGQLYRRMGDTAKARDVFKMAIKRGAFPSAAAASGDPFQRARRRLRTVIRYYRSAGMLVALRKKLEKAADADPKDALAHYELAAFFRSTGNRGKALKVLEKLSNARHDDPEVKEVLGRRYKERGDYRTAAKLFEESFEKGPFHKRSLYRDLIYCYRKIGERDKAFQLERKMAWEMGDEFALYRLSLRLRRKKRVREAVRAYKRYLVLKFGRYSHLSARRRNLRIALELAKFLRSNEQRAHAISTLEGYLPQVRGLPVTAYERRNLIRELTRLYRRAGVLKEKLADWDKRSQRDPFYLDLLYHYFEGRGNAKQKLALLERMVRLRPRDEKRIEALAREYSRRGRYDQAIATLVRLDGIASSPNYLKRIGSLYQYKGNRKKALYYWQKHVEALYTYPTYRDFRSHRLFALADILDRAGYRSLAEKSRIEAVDAAASVDAYRYGRIIGKYVRRGSYVAALEITLKAMEKVTDSQQRRNLLYALLPYGYYALRHLGGLRKAAEERKLFQGKSETDTSRADIAHLFYDILGERYRSAGKDKQAAEAFEQALRHRDDLDTLRNLVALYKRLGRGPEIADLYERLLARRPNHAPYLQAAATVYLKSKQYKKAIPLLERSVKAKPTVKGYLQLVQVLHRAGRSAEAEPHLMAARKVSPESLAIAEKLEEIYKATGATQKLETLYRSLAVHPKMRGRDLPRLATLLERGNRPFAAIEVYKTAVLKAGKGSWLRRQARDHLTRALVQLGHADLADDEIVREIPKAKKWAQIHEKLAVVFRRNRMPSKALGQLKRAAFLMPGRIDLWKRGAKLASELGLGREALSLVRWGRASAPEGAPWNEILAELKQKSGVASKALRRVLWRVPVGEGCAPEPVITGDVVISANCKSREVLAYDLRTGRRRWTRPFPKLPKKVRRNDLGFEWRFRATGLSAAGRRVVVALNEDQLETAPAMGTGRVRRLHLLALDVASGAVMWHRRYPGIFAAGPVTTAEGTAIVHGPNLWAVSLDDGHVLWHAYAGSYTYGWIFDAKNRSRVAVAGGLAYAAGRDGHLYAVDLSNGELRWKFHAGPSIHASPLAADGAVFVLSDDSYLYAVDASTGKLRWKFRGAADEHEERKSYGYGYYIQPRLRGRPAADRERLYFATGGGVIYALGLRDGRRIWRRKVGDRTGFDLRLSTGQLYVAGERHSLYVLSAVDGSIRWQYARPLGAPIQLANGVAVALLEDPSSTGERRLVALDVGRDESLRRRARALSKIAENLERNGDRALLDALLRNSASPVDSDFRSLYLRRMKVSANRGDVAAVLRAAARLLRLASDDRSWFGNLRQALQRALEANRESAGSSKVTGVARAVSPVAKNFSQSLRRHLDALPVSERMQVVPAELMLLASASTPAQKISLIRRLRTVKSPFSIPLLFSLTEDGNRAVRMISAVTLAESGDHSAKPALREALRHGPRPLRRAAVDLIAKAYVPEDLPALKTACSDPDRTVRRQAALIVAKHSAYEPALEVMRKILKRGSYDLQVRAAKALGKRGHREGLDVLRKLARTRKGPLQLRAANALYDLGDRSGLPILLKKRRDESGAAFLSTLRLVLGNIYMLLGDVRTALLEYRSILSFDGQFEKAYANIGRVYYLRGKYAKAVESFNRALALNPLLVSAHLYRGLSRARLGDTGGALSDLRTALRTNPDHKAVRLALAEVHVRRGELESAQRLVSESLRRWPLHAASFRRAAKLRLGEAGRGFANLKEADRLARAAVRLAPHSAAGRKVMAEVYIHQGRLADALKEAETARAAAVGSAERREMRKLVGKVRSLQAKGTIGS